MAPISIQLQRAIWYGSILVASFALTAVIAVAGLGPNAGWLFFLVWAMLCGIAARRGHLLVWASLCNAPLALISLLWLDALNHPDPFGLRLVYIQIFTGACLVTAATGVLALLPRDAAPKCKQLSVEGLNKA